MNGWSVKILQVENGQDALFMVYMLKGAFFVLVCQGVTYEENGSYDND